MNRSALLAWMAIDDARLDEWLAEGLPQTDGMFDPFRVAAWLERKGLVARENFHGVVQTLGDVAKAFGVSRGTVKKDWRSAGMPGQPGHFDLAAIAAWKQSRDRDPLDAASGPATEATSKVADLRERKLSANVRKDEATAISAERKNVLESESYLHRDDVERIFSEMLIATRNQLQGIPRRMIPHFSAERAFDLAEELTREINAALKSLAAWRPTDPAGTGAPDPNQSSPTQLIDAPAPIEGPVSE